MNKKLEERLDAMEHRYIARYRLVNKGKLHLGPNEIEHNIKLIQDYSTFMKKGIKLFLGEK